jgi:hypothetical protein
LASVRYRRRQIDHESTLNNDKLNTDERSSKNTKENLSTIEITSETESPNLSIVRKERLDSFFYFICIF